MIKLLFPLFYYIERREKITFGILDYLYKNVQWISIRKDVFYILRKLFIEFFF